MKMNFIKFLLVSFMSIGSCYAQWTAIRTLTGEAAQCNKWGWVEGNYQTVWHNACIPLEVKSSDGLRVYSIATTNDKCKGDEVALYQFAKGYSEIKFMGCRGHR